MLTGMELGAAIKRALELKVAQAKPGGKAADLARHFHVSAPSVQGWLNRGTISKARLPELWLYFSDVVGPDHWGLTDWPAGPVPGSTLEHATEDELTFLDDFRILPDDEQAEIVARVSARAAALRDYLEKQLQKFQKAPPGNPSVVDERTKPVPNDPPAPSALSKYRLDNLGEDQRGSNQNQRRPRTKGR